MIAAQNEFFAVIGEGAALLKTLDENSPEFFGSLNRLREILAMIGETPAAEPTPEPSPAPVADGDLTGTVVADDQGRPLVVYHGTDAVFDQFDPMAAAKNRTAPGLDAIGSWFTTDIEQAKRYGSTVKAVNLKLTKPMRFDSFDAFKEEWIDWNTMKGQSKDVKARHKNNPHHGDAGGFVDSLRRMGYDGIVIEPHSSVTSTEFAGGTTYIVFDGSQVKPIAPAAAEPEAPAPLSLTFNRAAPDDTRASLAAYLTTGLRAMPPELAAFEADTVAELAATAGLPDVARAAYSWTVDNRADDGRAVQTHQADTKIAVFDHYQKQGVDHGQDAARLKANIEDIKSINDRKLKDDPTYAAARAEYNKISSDRFNQLTAFRVRMNAAKDQAEIDAIQAEIDAFRAINDPINEAAADASDAASTAFYQARNAALDDIQARQAQAGQVIRAKVLESSPVTAEAAMAWARAQVIDDNTKAKLKRLKTPYPVEDVIRDMAEFYQMTGGKASSIRLAAGGSRANAVGVTTTTNEKIVNIDTSFSKRTLWHELAHFLENDPLAKAASNGFLLKRREGEKVYRLKDLTGIPYGRDEVAYKDHFIDAYVGKVYSNGVTEVFSMGVERLCSDKDAANFAAQDPEHYALVTGYLRNALTPAMAVKLNMHTDVLDEKAKVAATLDEEYAAAMAFFAGRGTVTADNWFRELDRTTHWYDMFLSYAASKEKTRTPQYVGSRGEYKVFSGIFKNQNTKRQSKGYMIVDALEDGHSNIPDYLLVHGDMDKVSAAIGIAESRPNRLRGVYYTYFFESARNWKQNVIELAKEQQ